jgi:aminoglycoside 3-N-acetyltransferase I
MDETLQVHTLGPDDTALLRAMLRMFGEAFEDPAHYTADMPDDAYLHDLLASPLFVALAARVGSECVGGIAGYLLPKFERAGRELYLYDLAVAAPHRRRGVATALIQALRAEARRLGARIVFVQAHVEDGPALALYRRFGEAAEVQQFDIEP